MELVEIVEYQIRSSRWASFISIDWMQELAAKYYIWKCKKRHKRYLKTLEREKLLKIYLENLTKSC